MLPSMLHRRYAINTFHTLYPGSLFNHSISIASYYVLCPWNVRIKQDSCIKGALLLTWVTGIHTAYYNIRQSGEYVGSFIHS